MFSHALIPKIKGLFAVVALEFHLLFMVSRSAKIYRANFEM